MVGRHAHPRADTEGVDRRARAHQLIDRELVEAAAREDAHLGETGTIEKPTAALGQRGEVAAVDANAEPAGELQVLDHRDGLVDAGDRVVRVDKECGAARKVLRKSAEGRALVGKRLDVRMRHRAGGREAVAPGRFDVAGRNEADHARKAGDVDARLNALGAAKREVDEVATIGRDDAARGFARDRRLEGDQVEQHGLDQLRLRQRCGDLEDRLARERHSAFGDRPHVPGEAESPESLQLGRPEALGLGQPADVVVLEAEVFEVIEARFDAGGDEETPRRGQRADEKAERRSARHAAAQVARGHVELVEVGEQRVQAGRRILI